MRNLLILMLVGLALAFSVERLQAQRFELKTETKQLKARQKEERKALKRQEKYTKQSWKGHPVPKSVKLQAKHQMQRQRRQVLERQRNDRQDLKDRQRALKESQKRTYGR